MRRMFAALAAISLVLLVYYLPWLCGWQVYYRVDLTLFYEPLGKFIGQSIQHLHLPLWNPYCYSGTPQAAITSPGIFYPPNLLFSVLPFSQALAWILLLHQLMAAIGAYLLVLSFGWGAIPALIAMLIFSLCGYMFALQSIYPLMANAAWLPFFFWSYRRLGRINAAAFSGVVPAALSTFAILSAGRPEIFAPAVLILVAAMLARFLIFSGSPRSGAEMKCVGFTLLAFFLGFLLSLPALVPAAEWTPLSERSRGFSVDTVLTWSANWYDFLCLVLQQPLGDLYEYDSRFLKLAAANPDYVPLFPSSYIGPVGLTLSIWGLGNSKFVWRWPIAALTLLVLIVVAGSHTPLIPWLVRAVPGVALFRYPVKLTIFAIFGLMLLAANGIKALLSNEMHRYANYACASLWAILLIVGIAQILPGSELHILPPMFWLPKGIDEPTAKQAGLLIGRASVLSAAIGLALAACAYLYAKNRLRKSVCTGVVVIALLGTLLSSAFSLSRRGAPHDYFQRPSEVASTLLCLSSATKYPQRRTLDPVLAIDSSICQRVDKHVEVDPRSGKQAGNLAKVDPRSSKQLGNLAKVDPINNGRQWRVLPFYSVRFNPPAGWHVTGDLTDLAISAHEYSRRLLYPNSQMDFGILSAYGYEVATLYDYTALMSQAFLRSSQGLNGTKHTDLPLARMAQITASRFILTRRRIPRTGGKTFPFLDSRYFELLKDNQDLDFRVYSLREPLTRAYFVSRWRAVSSHNEALNVVGNADESGFNPITGTVIESSAALPVSEHALAPDFTDISPPLPLILNEVCPEDLNLSVRAPSAGYVVISDQFYPGWHATVDGASTGISRANGTFRAIPVSAGEHFIELKYDPENLRLAIYAAMFAVLALLFIALRRN